MRRLLDNYMDICMTNDNYNKALKNILTELKKINIIVIKTNSKRIGITIWIADLILDIIPADKVGASLIKDIDDLRNRTVEYSRYYVKLQNDSEDSLKASKGKIIGRENPDNPIWLQNVEFNSDRCIFDNDMIFLLKTIELEGYEFFCPMTATDILMKNMVIIWDSLKTVFSIITAEAEQT